jgi:hypothetical protein
MTDPNPGARWASPAMQDHLRRRHRAERRFRRAGRVAIALALLGLATLLASIVVNGWSAFRATEIQLDVAFDPALFEGVARPRRRARTRCSRAPTTRRSCATRCARSFPDVEARSRCASSRRS